MTTDPNTLPITEDQLDLAMREAIHLMIAFEFSEENGDLLEFVKLLKETALKRRSYPASVALILAFVVLLDTQSPPPEEPGDNLYRYARLINALEAMKK